MTIRRIPEDFLVRERVSAAFADGVRPAREPGAAHAVYELRKTSLTTPEASQRLAKVLGARGVEYAGLKDRHAVTTQWITIPAARGEPPAQAEGPGWTARLVGWSSRPITAGDIDGNAFEIVVRGLSDAESREMDRRFSLLADGERLLVVNYFGAQRFGSARHGQGFVAKALIQGDFERALKLAVATPARKDHGKARVFTRTAASLWGQWQELARRLPRCPERAPFEALSRGAAFREAFATLPYFLQSMYVEAFQSAIWNATARRLATTIAADAPLLEGADADEGLAFPPAARAGSSWRGLVVPILAPSTELTEPWARAAREALADQGVGLADLKIPGLRRPFFGEAPRALFIRAASASLSPPGPDDMRDTPHVRRTLRCELPRGAYATVVLRALGQ